MFLATDEQTQNDLGLQSKRNNEGVVEIYNRTRTRGGEELLKQLFLHPLSDWIEINRRSSLLKTLSELKPDFPFDPDVFDRAEKYLAAPMQTGEKGTLSEKEIHNGVVAVIGLFQGMRTFIERRDIAGIASYAHERKALTILLTDPAFTPILRDKGTSKLQYTAMTAYDVLFRQQEKEKIRQLLEQVYLLDVYLSVSRLAAERGFAFPQALERGTTTLQLDGVYHPSLEHAIGNDVKLSGNKNVLFLTGANMAGKSTFLRSVSTAVYVAHIGFPVAARSMTFSVLEGIYTTINLPDNLGMGASHFYNEVLRVKKVATELHHGRSLFVVFDELFRGTNVKDAQEGTVEVASAFSNNPHGLFIVSSHIVEAGEELRKEKGVIFRYLPTRMKGHTPEYTYRLEEGITDDRHGMLIIRNEGILDILKKGRVK